MNLLSKIPDIEFEVITPIGIFRPPNTAEQGVVIDRAPGILDKSGEQLKLRWGKTDQAIVHLDGPGSDGKIIMADRHDVKTLIRP